MITRIPDVSTKRLSAYLRALALLANEGVDTISSSSLADRVNSNPAQVRKDLAYFGQFGRPGKGYNVKRLKEEIRKILGLNRRWPCILVGAGDLGSALCSHRSFNREGFQIKAIFDNNPDKIGKTWGPGKIEDAKRLPSVVKRLKIRIGIIAVPAHAAQEVADRLTTSGVKAILNFAPKKLSIPSGVRLHNVDLSGELENLAYYLSKGNRVR